jgi:two-component system, chemotaxis family, protein-glutamate methylesterase/glutaminase
MNKIRVLVVDKTAVERRMLADALASDSTIEVVGTAASAEIALAKIANTNPDVVLLKETMPDGNGAPALVALRAAHPQLPVVEYDGSPPSAREYSPGPDLTESQLLRSLRDRLVPRIKRSSEKGRQSQGDGAAPQSTPGGESGRSSKGPQRPRRIEIVAIGASTGGPRAVSALLASLPGEFPVPVVIVQHMLPSFTGYLTGQLAAQTSIPVLEGVAEGRVQPGCAWVAPGDHHMQLEQGEGGVRLRLHKGPPEHSCRPSVDVLFRSVAALYGAAALAVVLTGMGQDGLRGCESIRAAGGQVLAQDEETSVVWGMPGVVARAGLADAVLPLDRLGPEIAQRVLQGRRLSLPD